MENGCKYLILHLNRVEHMFIGSPAGFNFNLVHFHCCILWFQIESPISHSINAVIIGICLVSLGFV